ncbi:MAG: CPBP family intramembrane metalloprotease [Corynebacterium sp.]|uniref:CPBP family intramembrane glutamic endopeptidase n=1 Tax=Corynebacterium sp. TaxID=1720 RepID=UPI0026DB31EA|nr:CPBP family intramembrane glutamic endopeptidase [Corynebacterium sp.]MDO5099723.1 CPBP family intramembrane metalloprotease [Corynebacterium sp.]
MRLSGDHTTTETQPDAGRATLLIAVRLGLVVVVTGFLWLYQQKALGIDGFPPGSFLATIGLLPVNIVCLWLVVALYRRMGVTVRQAVGVRTGRIAVDIGWGLLWFMVLNLPFMVVIWLVMFAIYGTEVLSAFEVIFIDNAAVAAGNSPVAIAVGIVSLIGFVAINALTEELVFRGYGLAGLKRRLGATIAVVSSSVAFGMQHIFFASTGAAMLVYFMAFTVWGLIACVIVRRQGRLFPVLVAHALVNFLGAAPGVGIAVYQLMN